MDHAAMTETHRVRCPCGEIIYAAADSGVETCSSCGLRFRWRAQAAFETQADPHPEPTLKAQTEWNDQAAPQASESYRSPERHPVAVARPVQSSVAKTSSPSASFATVKFIYWVGYWITTVLLFLGLWIYCVASYGFIIGVLVVWLPSAIAAVLISFLWPLGVLLLVLLWRGTGRKRFTLQIS